MDSSAGLCNLLIVIMLLMSPTCLVWFSSTSSPLTPFRSFEHCSAYRRSVSGLSIPRQELDRSGRAARLASLDALSAQLQDLYIRSLNLATSHGYSARLSLSFNRPLCLPTPIIYECSYDCGGLGDRLKGLASTFFLALLTNSRFYYSWSFPTDVTNYFVASNSSLASTAKTANNFLGIKYLTMFEWWCMNAECMRRKRDITRTTTGNVQSLWTGYDSVISHTNMAYWDLLVRNPHLAAAARRYNLDLLGQDEMFYIFVRLFFTKLSGFMQAAMDPYKQLLEETGGVFKVGVQLRIGDKTPWHELPRHSLASVSCFVDKVVRKCHEQSGKKCMVFATADSPEALDRLRAAFTATGITMYETTGTISHIDKPTDNGLRAEDVVLEHSRVFMDWYLLTKMDYLYISRSGFGQTAAFAGLVPAEELDHRPEQEKQCTFWAWDGQRGSKLWQESLKIYLCPLMESFFGLPVARNGRQKMIYGHGLASGFLKLLFKEETAQVVNFIPRVLDSGITWNYS